jgi:hypothetical protein
MTMPKERVRECRDGAIKSFREALKNPDTIVDAVDSLIAASVAKINMNLRSELTVIRALVHAAPDETTYIAVRRIVNERDGISVKYRDARERMKTIIADQRIRIRTLERELEAEKSS